jgi:hypothetical protein
LQNISGNHAATWQQKPTADFPSLEKMKGLGATLEICIFLHSSVQPAGGLDLVE